MTGNKGIIVWVKREDADMADVTVCFKLPPDECDPFSASVRYERMLRAGLKPMRPNTTRRVRLTVGEP